MWLILQHDKPEDFVIATGVQHSVREFCEYAFREAGIEPVPQARAIMLIGGLRELTAMTVESGASLGDVAEEAVESAIALLRPRD